MVTLLYFGKGNPVLSREGLVTNAVKDPDGHIRIRIKIFNGTEELQINFDSDEAEGFTSMFSIKKETEKQ